MTEQESGKWLECKADKDYEIWNEYPYTIRRKGSNRICKECIDKGYVRCYLNGKACFKHRIIAIQFLPNPYDLTDIDHRNHNRADNRLENLRWTSRQDNMRNKSRHKGRHFFRAITNNSTDSRFL